MPEPVQIGAEIHPNGASIRHATGPARARAIVVGRPGDIPRALEHPAVATRRGLEAAGVLVIEEEGGDPTAQGAALDELLRNTGSRTLFVAGPLGRHAMRIVTDIGLLHGCRVIAVMPSEVVAGHDPVVVWQGEYPLVELLGSRTSEWRRVAKRIGDVTAAVFGLIVGAPILLAIALAVALDSRGPILFRHRRVGLAGREFPVLKFRTMVSDAETWLSRDPALARLYRENDFRLPDEIDPRITRVGRFLRRTSLDELPQLWNVLVGEMSLVGPRPIEAAELEHYAGSERLLLSVRPGLTGAWAVMGRHSVFHPQRAEIELRYVRSWSLRGDLGILWRTVGAVMRYDARPKG